MPQLPPMSQTLYDIPLQSLYGRSTTLAAYRSSVLLIVNTASRCGYTPQYAGLEALQQKFGSQGFVVLGFPCNQFLSQEPGTDSEIRDFCSTNYGVSFPMFAKVEVNGGGTHPLYRLLKSEATGVLGTEAIKWNFTKFLVNRAGTVVERFAPADTPASLEGRIEELLAEPRPAS
jgi:glutathione peroxidase